MFAFEPAQEIVNEHLQTFKDITPRQKPGSFSVDQALDLLTTPQGSN